MKFVREKVNLQYFFYDGMLEDEGLKNKAVGIPGFFSVQQSSVLIKSEGRSWIRKGDRLGKLYTVLAVDAPILLLNKSCTRATIRPSRQSPRVRAKRGHKKLPTRGAKLIKNTKVGRSTNQ